ncbi:MAG TPA: response regulator [Bryobacteraceae bacterium]|nr:response regulator [Bryobacteraceae bacterium]
MSKHRSRILIIEDNPGDVVLFQVALNEAGVDCELSEISNGRTALDFVHSEPVTLPDLVVLDLNLPKASGKEILAAIRSTPAFRPVPVVIWSSSNARVDRAELEGLGFTRYFVKPPEVRQLAPLGVAIKEILETAANGEGGERSAGAPSHSDLRRG